MKRATVGAVIGILVLIGSSIGLFLWLGSGDDSSTRRLYAAYTIVAPRSVSESQLVARALVDPAGGCPFVNAVGSEGRLQIPMTPRRPGPRAAPAFSEILACSASLPSGLSVASIEGDRIPQSMPTEVDAIGIFADSGCRLDDSRVQNCNDPNEWPLEQIVGNIVAAQPDLIFDPGDYVYREIRCPADKLDRCEGTLGPIPGFPFSESDRGWIQEFFEPARAMFSVAPIAFLRGNHEDCGRGGNGWFLYLDPFEDSMATCDPLVEGGELVPPPPQTTPSWTFDVSVAEGRTLRVAMVDSAYGSDRQLTPWVTDQRTMYQQAYDLTAPVPGVETWLQTHRPVFGMISSSLLPRNDPLAEPWTSDGQMVASYGLLDHYDLIISSHLHLAQVIQVPGQPASVVVGNGGALVEPTGRYEVPPFGPLATMDGSRLVATLEPYPRPTLVWTRVEYGYALARPAAGAGRWTIEMYDYDGQRSARCDLASRTIACPEVTDRPEHGRVD